MACFGLLVNWDRKLGLIGDQTKAEADILEICFPLHRIIAE